MSYLYSRILKKLRGKAVKNLICHPTSKIESGTTIIDCTIGKYSYFGNDCLVCNCAVGSFCSIADNVCIGGGTHPIDWLSTSCAFYFGRDSISKRLAQLSFDSSDKKTFIGNDVWIGNGAYVKPGVSIGDGSIVGMGSVVTKDVPPYSIIAGNPASLIRMRFCDDIVERLLRSQWWSLDDVVLKKISHYFDNPEIALSYIEKLK